VSLVLKVNKVKWAPRVLMDQREIKEVKVLLVQLEKEGLECQVNRVKKDKEVLQENLVQKGNLVM